VVHGNISKLSAKGKEIAKQNKPGFTNAPLRVI